MPQKRSLAQQKHAKKMTKEVYTKAQLLRDKAVKKNQAPICLPMAHNPGVAAKKARRPSIQQPTCKSDAWKAPPGHADALKSLATRKRLGAAIRKSYKKRNRLDCKRGGCHFTIRVRKTSCPGLYKFTSQFEAKGNTNKILVQCRQGAKCELAFKGGCKNLSGNRDKYAAHPSKLVKGKCYQDEKGVVRHPTQGYIKITKGSGVRRLWSKVIVSPGERMTFDISGGSDAWKNADNALLATIGAGKIEEPTLEKLGRVCNNLRLKEDDIIREGIAKFRFSLA